MKNMLFGCFRDSSREWSKSQPSHEFKWSNSQVFQLWTESFVTMSRMYRDLKLTHDSSCNLARRSLAHEILRLARESLTREMPRISFLKGILWFFCLKHYSIFSQTPKSKFLHQNPTNFNCFSFY